MIISTIKLVGLLIGFAIAIFLLIKLRITNKNKKFFQEENKELMYANAKQEDDLNYKNKLIDYYKIELADTLAEHKELLKTIKGEHKEEIKVLKETIKQLDKDNTNLNKIIVSLNKNNAKSIL